MLRRLIVRRPYSLYDRVWSGGISKLGNLSFFDDGWGTPDELRLFRNKIQLIKSLDITKYTRACQRSIELTNKQIDGEFVILTGRYVSPINTIFTNERIWPRECHNGSFQIILPRHGTINGIAIHTAGTGDHGFTRRAELIAKPLLTEHNVASVIMENPFYAARKPKRQNYSGLRKWIDLLSLSMGVALEGNALRQWLVERNIKTVGFTGISLGGHLAAICASCCPEPVPCVPAYCWSSSAGVWTRGALSKRVNFTRLTGDYTSSRDDYDRFAAELGNHGLQGWLDSGNCPYDDISLSPEVSDMMHNEAEVARNYTVHLAHFFSHLGNYRLPVDPSLCHFISGTQDLFYGAEKLTSVDRVWPGVQVLVTR